jgi:GH24 family phage-related lysozyme (muramidase)
VPYSQHDYETFNGNWEPPPDNPNFPGVSRPDLQQVNRPRGMMQMAPAQNANPGFLGQMFPRLGQMGANLQSRRAQFATNHPFLSGMFQGPLHRANLRDNAQIMANIAASGTPRPTGGGSAAPGSAPQTGGDPTLSLLRGFEGYRADPYWDVNAYRAGYGSDTVTLADGRVVPVTQGMTVSREDAERDLLRRTQTEFGPQAQSQVGAAWNNYTPEQQAALISITYNYGSLPSSVARAAATGDAAAVNEAILGLQGHNDGINANRRASEAAYFGG